MMPISKSRRTAPPEYCKRGTNRGASFACFQLIIFTNLQVKYFNFPTLLQLHEPPKTIDNTSNMDPSETEIPPVKNLTIDNITENVKLINSRCPDPRLKYLMDRLVQHTHDFARETRLSHNEWMTAIQFLTSVGQICSDVRQVCSWP